MDTFKKFQNAVWSAYTENRDEWPHLLKHPSPANLRDYSLERLTEGLSINDCIVLKEFFRLGKNNDDMEAAIRKIDIDMFRPLQNFIKVNTAKPDERIVKMLAVLIDFQPRPYCSKDWCTSASIDKLTRNATAVRFLEEQQEKKQQDKKDIILLASTEEVRQTAKHPLSITSAVSKDLFGWNKTKNWLHQKKQQILLVGSAALCLTLGSGYFINKKDCMIWNGERYVQVNCKDSKLHINPAIALDIEKLLYFQKVTRIDTFKKKDTGRVWYSKVNHEVAFFTTAEHSPENDNSSLKSTTAHIVYTYALHKTIEEKSLALDSIETIIQEP